MKSIILLLLLVAISSSVICQSRIVVEISNFRNDHGVVRACLFNSANSFKSETGSPFQCRSIAVKNLTCQVTFTNVPAGKYAVFVFHDANSNNRMDKNFIGIPKEGYGASKNKLPFASAPAYDENSFIVENNTTVNLRIKLRNL